MQIIFSNISIHILLLSTIRYQQYVIRLNKCTSRACKSRVSYLLGRSDSIFIKSLFDNWNSAFLPRKINKKSRYRTRRRYVQICVCYSFFYLRSVTDGKIKLFSFVIDVYNIVPIHNIIMPVICHRRQCTWSKRKKYVRWHQTTKIGRDLFDPMKCEIK